MADLVLDTLQLSAHEAARLEVMKEQILGERAGFAEDIRFLRDKKTMEMLAMLLRVAPRT